MPFNKTEYIWMNGKYIKWDDAKIHVLSHVVHYGSSVFEGERCYETSDGPACFRHDEHVDRLFKSAKVYRMEIPFTKDQINTAILDLISINKLKACYIRPFVFRGYDTLGVHPKQCPVEVVIATWPWGAYLGADALEKGVRTCVSSWNRLGPNTMPTMSKAGGNYLSSQLITMEAQARGYDEGISLDTNGYISEGSAENIFAVYKGKLITPPLSAAILPGITRDTVMTIAGELGFEVSEQNIPREMVYIADELFFTGTAAEVSPLASVDDIPVGIGKRGPITEKIQKAFFDYLEGRVGDKHNWLTHVPKQATVPVE